MKTLEALKAGYLARLAAERAESEAKCAAYQAAGCGDDADLEKIRLNIIGVFTTLVEATHGADRDAWQRAYLARFDTIPMNWRQRLGEAQAHSDTAAAAVEELKLAAMERLRAIFLEECERT